LNWWGSPFPGVTASQAISCLAQGQFGILQWLSAYSRVYPDDNEEFNYYLEGSITSFDGPVFAASNARRMYILEQPA
jgi:hypothetical protein